MASVPDAIRGDGESKHIKKEAYLEYSVAVFRWVLDSGHFGHIVYAAAQRDFEVLVAGTRHHTLTEDRFKTNMVMSIHAYSGLWDHLEKEEAEP